MRCSRSPAPAGAANHGAARLVAGQAPSATVSFARWVLVLLGAGAPRCPCSSVLVLLRSRASRALSAALGSNVRAQRCDGRILRTTRVRPGPPERTPQTFRFDS